MSQIITLDVHVQARQFRVPREGEADADSVVEVKFDNLDIDPRRLGSVEYQIVPINPNDNRFVAVLSVGVVPEDVFADIASQGFSSVLSEDELEELDLNDLDIPMMTDAEVAEAVATELLDEEE